MRNVEVTGGSDGIGYAIAETFVGAGDAVVITGRRAEVLLAAAGASVGTPSARQFVSPGVRSARRRR